MTARWTTAALAFGFSACAPSAPAIGAGHPARDDAPTAPAAVEVTALAPAPPPALPAPLRPDAEPPGDMAGMNHGSMDGTSEMDHAGMDHAAMDGMDHSAMADMPDVDPEADRRQMRDALDDGAVSARELTTAGRAHAMPVDHAMSTDHAASADGTALARALDAYLAVQAALAADRVDASAAQTFADAFGAAADEMPDGDPHFWHSRADETGAVREAAAALAAAGDLDAARLAFGRLSVPFAALLTAHGVPEGYDLARFTCGMARGVPEGGVWLQMDGELRNPYFGAAMLTCGRRDVALPSMEGEMPMDHGSMDHEQMGHDGHRP